MDKSFIILFIASITSLTLVVVHMIKFRGRKTAFYFIFFCLLFGILRAYAIHWIQLTQNNSFLPYAASQKLLIIGKDSPQIYIGWLITTYLSWCIAEFILEKFINLKNKLFPTVGIAFLMMASFSYMIEVAASFTGWWHWNQYLSAIAKNNIFFNVPWIGIIDWGAVAFDFLLPFLVISTFGYKKIFFSLASLLFPAAHIFSHLKLANFVFQFSDNFRFTLGQLYHYFMVLLPLAFILFTFSTNYLFGKRSALGREKMERQLIYGALGILVITTILIDALYGNNWQFIISLIPICTFIIYSFRNFKFGKLFYLFIFILFPLLILPADPLIKQRVSIIFCPFLYLWLLEKILKEAKEVSL